MTSTPDHDTWLYSGDGGPHDDGPSRPFRRQDPWPEQTPPTAIELARREVVAHVLEIYRGLEGIIRAVNDAAIADAPDVGLVAKAFAEGMPGSLATARLGRACCEFLDLVGGKS